MDRSLEEANVSLIERWFELVWNQRRADLIDEFRAPDAKAIGLGEGRNQSLGPTPFKSIYTNLLETFPDLHVTIDDIFAAGEKVAVRTTFTGTHHGEVLGIPASHGKVTFTAIILVRIVDGRIAEAWNSFDQYGLLRQLGLPEIARLRPDFFLTRP